MSVTANTLRKLAMLNLSSEQMAGVLDILADGAEAEERRLAAIAGRTRLYRQRGGDQISRELREAVMTRDNATCQECGSLDHPQLDHIHPVSKGGETSFANLQVLCRPCNARKRDRVRKSIPRNSTELTRNSANNLSPKEKSPTPPKEITPIRSEALASSPNARKSSEFDVWYQHYPHKVQRGQAERAFVKALSLAGLEELIAGVHRYVASKPADRQWQNPATWLNGKGWMDAPAAIQQTADPPPKKTTLATMWHEEARNHGILNDPPSQTDRHLDASLPRGQDQGSGFTRRIASA